MIVVSPLIAIMEEQETFLLLKGLKAVYIGGDNVDLEALSRGEYNYVFASPESILAQQRKLFTNPVYKAKIGAVFIDETH